MNPEIELIIKAQNEAKQTLLQLRKQLRDLENQVKRNDRANRQLSRSFGSLAPVLIEFNRASSIAARGLFSIGRNIVQAAADFETYENTVRVFSDTQAEANRRIAELVQFSTELVGLDTGSIISFFGRLTEAGLRDNEAIQAIKGITEALAEQGKGADRARLVLEQFFQAVSTSRISAQDFRSIFREVPQLPRAIEMAFGESANTATQFRELIERVGVEAPEAIRRIIPALDEITEGADINTLNAQFDILQDQAAVTAARFGELLVPSIVNVLQQITDMLEYMRSLDEDTRRLIVTIGATGAGGATLIAGFTGLTLAIGAMNAALKISVGATGLAGLSKIIGSLSTAVPILTGAFYALEVAIAALLPGLALYRDLTYESERGTEALFKSLVNLGKTEGIEALTNALRPLRQEYIQLLEELNIREPDIEIPQLAETPIAASNVRESVDRLVQLYNLLNQIGPVLRELRETPVEPVPETAPKAVRNLTLELVKADTMLRRIRNTIRTDSAQTIEIIKSQTQAEINALENLARLEVEEAQASIKNEQERAARIQEINDRLADDIAAASQRGQDRIKAYEDAVYEARRQSGQAFVDARRAQEQQLVSDALDAQAQLLDFNFRQFLSDFNKLQTDETRAANIRQLSLHANVNAKLVTMAEEREQAMTQFWEGEDRNRIFSTINAVNLTTSEWQKSLDAQQNLEALRTQIQQAQLKERERQYAQYFQYINQLNTDSAEQFIASAISVTSAIVRQILIEQAVRQAASGNIPAAIGLGIAAVGASALDSVISNAIRGQQRTSASRTFHNANNDALVEMAVSRALTARGASRTHQEIVDNRQQARDVGQAVDRGIRSAPDAPIVVNLEATLPIQFSDQVVETITTRQQVLARRGQ